MKIKKILDILSKTKYLITKLLHRKTESDIFLSKR